MKTSVTQISLPNNDAAKARFTHCSEAIIGDPDSKMLDCQKLDAQSE